MSQIEQKFFGIFLYKSHFMIEFYNQINLQEKMGRRLLRKGQIPDQFQTELYDKITKIEAQVLERIQKLKTNSKSFLCEHMNVPHSECQPYDQNVNYYDRFWKRFLINEIGKQNVVQFKEQLQNFTKRLSKIQSLFEQWNKQLQPIMKAKRKPAAQQQGERFMCSTCSKGYRDQQTLMLHIKIKHKKTEETPVVRRRKQEEEIYEQENDE